MPPRNVQIEVWASSMSKLKQREPSEGSVQNAIKLLKRMHRDDFAVNQVLAYALQWPKLLVAARAQMAAAHKAKKQAAANAVKKQNEKNKRFAESPAARTNRILQRRRADADRKERRREAAAAAAAAVVA